MKRIFVVCVVTLLVLKVQSRPQNEKDDIEKRTQIKLCVLRIIPKVGMHGYTLKIYISLT